MNHERTHAVGTTNPTSDLDRDVAPGRESRTAELVGPTGPRPSGLLQKKQATDVPLVEDVHSPVLKAHVTQTAVVAATHHSLANAALSETPRASTAPAPAKALPTNAPHEPPVAHSTKVQRLGSGAAAFDPQAVVAKATSGNAGTLPHLDSIQKSFGSHDVSGVRAHVGGAAADAANQIGAVAFASGNSIAFREAPDLHTAAHEAAHVVQQRRGASPKGGVGEPGDEYERHADTVADTVVRGESAERLLGAPASSGGSSAVQMMYDTKPPSSLSGVTVIEAPTNKLLPSLATPPPTHSNQDVAPPVMMPAPSSALVASFLGKARGVDATSLTMANEQRGFLDIQIAVHGALIDKALAADRASGVMLDPGLETAINVHVEATGLATSDAGNLRGIRGQIVGLTTGISGLKAKAKAEADKSRTDDESSEQQAKAAEEIASAHKRIEIVGDMAIDSIALVMKLALKPEDVVASGVDEMALVTKSISHIWNLEAEESETADAKRQITLEWKKVKEGVTEDNAAAVETQVDGIEKQIEGLKTQGEAFAKALATHLVTVAKTQLTIMKNKSPVTALAAIQDFIREVGAHADHLRPALLKARGLAAWDYWGTGDAACSSLSAELNPAIAARDQWMNLKPVPNFIAKGGFMETAVPEFEAWQKELDGLEQWIVNAQLWFASITAETSKQLEFISGPHMQKAEDGMKAIASLGDGKNTK